jgi:hypothetical protein
MSCRADFNIRPFFASGEAAGLYIITASKLVVCTSPRRAYYWLNPSRGTEGLAPHYYLGQPLKAAVFFSLLILATRERVNVFFQRYLVFRVIFF